LAQSRQSISLAGLKKRRLKARALTYRSYREAYGGVIKRHRQRPKPKAKAKAKTNPKGGHSVILRDT